MVVSFIDFATPLDFFFKRWKVHVPFLWMFVLLKMNIDKTSDKTHLIKKNDFFFYLTYCNSIFAYAMCSWLIFYKDLELGTLHVGKAFINCTISMLAYV